MEDDVSRLPQLRKSRFLSEKKNYLLSGPIPVDHFGRCGTLKRSSITTLHVQDPATQTLTWYVPPASVLVIKKLSNEHIQRFVEIIKWLIVQKEKVVYVERSTFEDARLQNNPEFTNILDKLKTFTPSDDDLSDKVDLIVCLGGDGCLLHANSLFTKSVPPVVAFYMGSFDFLTPFSFDVYREVLTDTIENNPSLMLRSRLRCTVLNNDGSPSLVTYPVLNEVVINRGLSPYPWNIDLSMQGKYITTMEGNGLIVSTPTGSTAYAASAGASLIHPSVPSLMVTPICSNSLSFRPLVVPAGVQLDVSISPNSQSSGWVSFDGRNRQEFRDGDTLQIRVSRYPLPSVCSQDQMSEWTTSLAKCLNWNVREQKKPNDDPISS